MLIQRRVVNAGARFVNIFVHSKDKICKCRCRCQYSKDESFKCIRRVVNAGASIVTIFLHSKDESGNDSNEL